MNNPTRSTTALYGASTALLAIDLQNDFADREGSLYIRGGEELIASANREIAEARRAGSPVFYTQDWHPEHTPHFARDGGVWPVHCVRETWGAQLVPTLYVAGAIVRKGTAGEDGYSGFAVRDPVRPQVTTQTQLESLLRSRNVGRVVVIGLATDYCVKETARDALRLGFGVTLLRDATRAADLTPGEGERVLAELARAGAQVV